MIKMNNFFAILCMVTMASVLVVKAEDTKQPAVKAEDAQQTSELQQYLNRAKEIVTKIDTAEIEAKLVATDKCARRFFTTYPTEIAVTAGFFAGKAWVNYQKANNASKYFNIEKDLNVATMSKEITHQIKDGVQTSKDFFVRSCKKAGRRNGFVASALLMGNIYYNRMQKEVVTKKETIIDDNQTAVETLKKNKDDLAKQL